MKSFIKVFFAVFFLACTLLISQNPPSMVKDLVSGSGSLNPWLSAVAPNGELVFSVAGYNNFLYRSNGTASGTYSFTGSDGNWYGQPLGHFNNKIYYTYQEDAYVVNSNFSVTRLKSFSTRGWGWGPTHYTQFNNKVIFYVQLEWKSTMTTDKQLWITDGTSKGTLRIKDLNPDGADFVYAPFIQLGNNMLFWNYHPTSGNELWKTDGTSAGTVIVKDIYPGTGSSYTPTNKIANFTRMHAMVTSYIVYNNKMYFAATDAINGNELWVTDGTSAGTALRANIAAGAANSNATQFCMLGSKLFFTACDAEGDYELYFLDLSNDASTPVKISINPTYPGTSWQQSSSPIWLTNFNGKIYFSAFEPTAGRELWSTDGTTTALLANINPDDNGVKSSCPNDTATHTNETKIETRGFYIYNNYMYFMADDGTHGFELWRSNGETTELVSDIVSGSTGSYPSDFLAAGNILYFGATTPAYGRELWRYPGIIQLKSSVEEEELAGRIPLYPNPSSEFIILQNYVGEIEIYNSIGISILKTNLAQGSRIWVNDFENGIYFIRTENDLLKFIVNK